MTSSTSSRVAATQVRWAAYLGCKIALTQARTHWLWRNWLTYMDSTPPILPEPKVSADGAS